MPFCVDTGTDFSPGTQGFTPIPVAAPSKAWVCGRSLAGSNLAGRTGRLSLLVVVCLCWANHWCRGVESSVASL
jgi:hypothetical protein